MIEFELINPSDPYTFFAQNEEVASLIVFCLSTMYGAKSKDKTIEIPVFIFGGAKEWYFEKFNRTPDEGLESEKEAVKIGLNSFMYGSFEDRERYELALSLIDDEDKKEEFKIKWNDARSSINDIGTYAHKLAKKII